MFIKLTAVTKNTIKLLLEFIRSGMISTLISFGGEYYEYNSDENIKKGSEKGGHELVFLVRLVASYLFEKSKTILNRKTYHGIYCNNSQVMFKEKKV